MKVLRWSKSIIVVCLALSVRTHQTWWIMQCWLWVMALKRTGRHIGLWRTPGAQHGGRMGKYSLCAFQCDDLLLCSRFMDIFLFYSIRYFWIERGKNMCGLATCSSYPLPAVWKVTRQQSGGLVKQPGVYVIIFPAMFFIWLMLGHDRNS